MKLIVNARNRGWNARSKIFITSFFSQFIFIQNVNGAISEQPQFGARATNRGIFQTRRENSQTICTILPALPIPLRREWRRLWCIHSVTKTEKKWLFLLFFKVELKNEIKYSVFVAPQVVKRSTTDFSVMGSNLVTSRVASYPLFLLLSSLSSSFL